MHSTPTTAVHFPRWLVSVFAFVCLFAGQLMAVGDDVIVTYNWEGKNAYPIAGFAPQTGSFTLNVTSPTSETIQSYPADGLPITLTCFADLHPYVSQQVAESYISFSPAQLRFTAPGQTKTVTVSFNIPESALNKDVNSGAYTYILGTTGWADGVDYSQEFEINAIVSNPNPNPPSGNAPVVTITAPTQTSYVVSTFPITLDFTFTGTTDTTSPLITGVAAMFGTTAKMDDIAANITSGYGTTSVSAAGTFTVAEPGTYTLKVTATNAVGKGADEETITFTVLGAGPPTASIQSPTPGTTYTYRLGETRQPIDFSFKANSVYGGIRTLTAFMNGESLNFVSVGIGTLEASGFVRFDSLPAGEYSLRVEATNDYGAAPSAQSNFTIVVIAPVPTVDITTPSAGAFTLPSGATTMDVPYAFTASSTNDFKVNSVTATLTSGSTTTTVSQSAPEAVTYPEAGTLPNLAAGTYTLQVTATSAGISAQDSVTFTIAPSSTPPTVVINQPLAGEVFSANQCGKASVPFSFTGQSTTTGAVITAMTATLDGTPINFTTTGLNQATVTGSATLSVGTGSHTIVVSATDAHGTVSATRTFSVEVASPPKCVIGEVFFDVDADGREDCAEFGLKGVTVKLLNANQQVVATDETSCWGFYYFEVPAGEYTVVVTVPEGLRATTPATREIWVHHCWTVVPDIGLGLDLPALAGMTADGYTIGYWKNNLAKALSCKSKGAQVSRDTLDDYTDAIADFAKDPFDWIDMWDAKEIMSSTSSRPTELLKKQLLASEYNYQNGAYLNGNRNLTFLFLYWGEHVLSNACRYSAAEIIQAKDWFDAYNNTHGGALSAP